MPSRETELLWEFITQNLCNNSGHMQSLGGGERLSLRMLVSQMLWLEKWDHWVHLFVLPHECPGQHDGKRLWFLVWQSYYQVAVLLENYFTFFSFIQILSFLKRRVSSGAPSISYSIFYEAKSGSCRYIILITGITLGKTQLKSLPPKGSTHPPPTLCPIAFSSFM